MKYLLLLFSPSSVWDRIKEDDWITIPILVGLVSALNNLYISKDPQVMYLKSEAILRLARDEFFTLPEGEGIIRLTLTLSFILLPLWYMIRVVITGQITRLVFREIDYREILVISSLSILPVIPIRLILTWFLQSKGLDGLSDLNDLNLTLGLTIFYAFNRDILKNDLLFLSLREINLLNIWSTIIFVSLFLRKGISVRYSLPVYLICITVVRLIEILWERYGYNIIWFFLVGG